MVRDAQRCAPHHEGLRPHPEERPLGRISKDEAIELEIVLNHRLPWMNILAISGSLRATSLNTAVLQASGRLAPAGVTIEMFEGIGNLPFFNSDLDGDRLPREVAEFRAAIGAADGLLISSPEYARGVAGVMKNALDWLVGSFEFPNKPVMLVNTSPRATHALAALTI